ncbi:PAS domain-containing sensor histidine kinase [Lutibacter sp.]|uniref:sensor histidine kinase n=1 Tax=Lutibacter sp. TaxID=1925666 RepID=UPI001A1F2E49|nr:PAS domain-containing sensor histidine kinase [Lutibacter sp.]MBI9039948.1 PAS domain-containing sensor histidine kinase [Lutibacter sp.]
MKNIEAEKTNHRKLKNLGKLNLSAIFENTTDSVWAINKDYEILYANEIFVEAFYVNFGIYMKPGTNLLLSLPKPLRELWKSKYDRALGNESFSFIDNVRANNTSLYIEVFMNPIIIKDKVIGALFFGKDITKRKLDEQALIDSQLLLKSSLESQRNTILFSINKEYRYLYFNSAHVKTMKHAYGKDVKVGMNILDCITSDEDRVIAKNNYDRALSGETHTNIRVFGKENLAYYESFFNPILNDSNEIIGATGLARDISERKKTELALIDSERKLKELNATKDKLFSIIAHDLRGPFNTILGFSDLLINSTDTKEIEKIKEFSSFINVTARNTLSLLDNLLHWGKVQTGQINFNPEKLMISSIIQNILETSRSNTIIKNIAINFIPSGAIEVFADQNMLETVLRNLISNAIKFTNLNGEISINTLQDKDFCEITISDNGVGMNAERCKQLFSIDINKTTKGTANEKGSGLGLVLCKEFVEKQGGIIWVESKEGHGSSFKFTLPLYK